MNSKAIRREVQAARSLETHLMGLLLIGAAIAALFLAMAIYNIVTTINTALGMVF